MLTRYGAEIKCTWRDFKIKFDKSIPVVKMMQVFSIEEGERILERKLEKY